MHRILCALALCLSSCASIVSKSDWPVRIDSSPSGAKITIRDADGEIVHVAQGPTTVTLSSDGGYFSGADYSIEADLAGHAPARLELESRLNPWFWGNLLFGGLIGMFIVDPITGAMWKLKGELVVTLAPAAP